MISKSGIGWLIYKSGVVIKQALSAASEVVAKGLYNATTLSTVDADLATDNIKSGKTIFGKDGKAEVVDTTSGDAVAGDIRTGKKAWVDGAEITGDIPEVAIAAGSENVPAGIHTATTLSTIDPDLAVGNIKKDVVIFGKTGTLEVSLTVTQRLGASAGSAGFDTVWETKYTVGIPDTETRVIAWARMGAVGGQAHCRILYNGVEKASASGDGATTGAVTQWEGAGLGSAADIVLQYKTDGGYTGYYGGGCWSIH